jgi:hypothetical protein
VHFSCTSSTLDQLINELKLTYLDPNATGLIDGTTEAALKRVLDFIQGPRWNASQHARIEITHPSPERDNIIDDAPVDDNGRLRLNVNLLTSGSRTIIEEEIKNQVASNSFTDSLLRKYLKKIGIKHARDHGKNKEKLMNHTFFLQKPDLLMSVL